MRQRPKKRDRQEGNMQGNVFGVFRDEVILERGKKQERGKNKTRKIRKTNRAIWCLVTS